MESNSDQLLKITFLQNSCVKIPGKENREVVKLIKNPKDFQWLTSSFPLFSSPVSSLVPLLSSPHLGQPLLQNKEPMSQAQ